MRKLKLQMLTSLNGIGLTPLDVQEDHWKWDDEGTDFCIENLATVDAIVLGRNTADGFINYWHNVAKNPNDKEYKLGKPIDDIPKVVFTHKAPDSEWLDTTVVSGDIVEEINKLKHRDGKDLLVYGGYSFVSELVKNDLVDDYSLLIQPLFVGQGQSFLKDFHKELALKQKECRVFPSGVVLMRYAR